MDRRDFVRQSLASAAALGVFPASLAAVERETRPGQLERRAYGATGEKLSIVAFGGFMLNRSTPEQAAQLVREAVEAGVNHFDVAPSYGNSEERLAPALAPFRKDVFLSCKTQARGAAGATAELEKSLTRLKTDHFDLYQLHAMTRLEDVDRVFRDDGAIKAFEAAKAAGKVRYLGFSAHSVEAALALMDRYAFDSIMFPVNYATWHAGRFGPQVLAKAHEKKMGILALKALAKQPWPKGADRKEHPNCWYQPMTDPDEAALALRFTLSHPVTTALTPSSPAVLKLALDLGRKFTPLTADEVATLKRNGEAATPIFRYQGK